MVVLLLLTFVNSSAIKLTHFSSLVLVRHARLSSPSFNVGLSFPLRLNVYGHSFTCSPYPCVYIRRVNLFCVVVLALSKSASRPSSLTKRLVSLPPLLGCTPSSFTKILPPFPLTTMSLFHLFHPLWFPVFQTRTLSTSDLLERPSLFFMICLPNPSISGLPKRSLSPFPVLCCVLMFFPSSTVSSAYMPQVALKSLLVSLFFTRVSKSPRGSKQ